LAVALLAPVAIPVAFSRIQRGRLSSRCPGNAPVNQKPLGGVERDQVAWLGDVERRAILPLQWVAFALCGVHWVWLRGWTPPGPEVFGLAIFFLGSLAAEHYFFARDRITPRQVRPFVLGSFIVDALFVTILIIIDNMDRAIEPALPGISEYFLLYVLLILRGFALFRTREENLFGFLVASLLFVGAAWQEIATAPVLQVPAMAQRLALMWGLMLLTQGFVGLVNAQKEESLRARERLLKGESLASLGEISAGVAHEINNPIGIIKAYAEYLERATKPDDPMREDFEIIRREADRCQEIVRRMLDLTNPQVKQFERIDMAALARETASFVFHDHAEGAIVAEVLVPSAPPPAMGDAVQLKQALINILMNAKQVLEEHGGGERRVVIRVARGTGPRPPVRLEIRDNGPGLSPQDADRAFEPFYTRRSKGTGLGLAITRRIVEAHSGSIRIAGHPDGGAVVTVELPIAGEDES